MSHEQIWAPWRLAYIKSEKPPEPSGCFLCRYRDAPEEDADNFVVTRSEHALVVLNRYPYNNGHLMIAPTAHVGSLEDVNDAVILDAMQQLRRMTGVLTRLLSPQGFNIGLNLGSAAGAGLPGHLHWHIVPRWTGDTNFMDVLADTSVIPQSLTALYQAIQEAL